MAQRCKSIAGQKVTLGPGKPILAGSELIGGTAICSGIEEFPIQFIEDDGCISGDDGATLIWPDTGNDLIRFDENEHVPVGTNIHRGQVNDGGTWFGAPHTVENEGAYAGGGGSTEGSGDDDGEDKGFCVGAGDVNLPTEEEKDWLSDLANLEIPDLNAFIMSGFTAKIQKEMGKLTAILGKTDNKSYKDYSKGRKVSYKDFKMDTTIYCSDCRKINASIEYYGISRYVCQSYINNTWKVFNNSSCITGTINEYFSNVCRTSCR